MRFFVILAILSYVGPDKFQDMHWFIETIVGIYFILAVIADWRDAFGRNCEHK